MQGIQSWHVSLLFDVYTETVFAPFFGTSGVDNFHFVIQLNPVKS